MKREEFLWPLTQSHHRALMAARRTRERLSPGPPAGETGTLQETRAELQRLYDGELRRHFKDEEGILDLFEESLGVDDPDAARVRKEHRFLESLLRQGTGATLLLFAETLVPHIRFEEDVLFGRIEKALTEEGKKAAEKILKGERA